MGPQLVQFLAACALLRAASGSALGDRGNVGIIGGNEISIDKAPYMAALYKSYDDRFYTPCCGGSIIHERFILTADHCINGNDIKEVTSRIVTVGSNRLQLTGTIIFVEKPLCYNAVYKYRINDICLLKLREPVPFGPNVVMVTLPKNGTELAVGTKVKVSGWGYITNDANATMVLNLRQVEIPTVSRQQCLIYFPTSEANNFCAGSDGRGICGGDSGGPLVYNNVQFGIAITGHNNSCGNMPELYLNVTTYLGWINSTITDNL